MGPFQRKTLIHRGAEQALPHVPGPFGHDFLADRGQYGAARRTVSYWPLATYNVGMAAPFFEEMKSRIGFGEEDVAHLRWLTPVLTPSLTAIADAFYDWLFQDPRAQALFTGGQEQMDRQRLLFSLWIV